MNVGLSITCTSLHAAVTEVSEYVFYCLASMDVLQSIRKHRIACVINRIDSCIELSLYICKYQSIKNNILTQGKSNLIVLRRRKRRSFARIKWISDD